MEKYILILYWPMCSWKSTVAKLFLEKTLGVFHISFDKIKFLISDFSLGKYPWIVNHIAVDLSKSAIEKWFSLLVEWNLWIQWEYRTYYKELASNHWYTFLEINIEASIEVLTERFLQRVEKAKEIKSKITVTQVEQMMERYNWYIHLKKDSIDTISSDTSTPEQIYEQIALLLQK